MKKITLFLLCFLVILNAFSQENLSISIKKTEFDDKFGEEDKQKLNNYIEIFDKQIYKSIDSLSKVKGHFFEGYEQIKKGILISSKIIPPKNERQLFNLQVSFLDVENNYLIENFIMSAFLNIKKQEIIISFKSMLDGNLSTVYLLYLHSLKEKIEKIANNANHKLNIYIKQPTKKLKQNSNDIIKKAFENTQVRNNNFNLIFEKKDIKTYKNIVEFSYTLKEIGENYVFNLVFKGKNIILKYPSGELIKTTFKLNKKRFDARDYLEFGYLLMPTINSFIIMNK